MAKRHLDCSGLRSAVESRKAQTRTARVWMLCLTISAPHSFVPARKFKMEITISADQRQLAVAEQRIAMVEPSRRRGRQRSRCFRNQIVELGHCNLPDLGASSFLARARRTRHATTHSRIRLEQVLAIRIICGIISADRKLRYHGSEPGFSCPQKGPGQLRRCAHQGGGTGGGPARPVAEGAWTRAWLVRVRHLSHAQRQLRARARQGV